MLLYVCKSDHKYFSGGLGQMERGQKIELSKREVTKKTFPRKWVGQNSMAKLKVYWKL